MKRRIVMIPLSALCVVVVAALAIYLIPRLFDTRLTFKFQDAVSKSWVWDATATLEDREIRSYYQSSAGPVDYTFTNLRPGRATLVIKAPDYVTVRMPVRLRLGNNVLAKPIEMVGYRIAGLARFVMFEKPENSGLSVQIRPVNEAGHAITVLPCLPLWIGALVSEETKNGSPVEGPAGSGATRGVPLYRGEIHWSWDSSPSQNFRYSARIPYSALRSQSAAELVVDYLVIVPDPRKISGGEITSIMQNAPDLKNPAELSRYLDRKKAGGRFEYFVTTSWNVPGPAAPASS